MRPPALQRAHIAIVMMSAIGDAVHVLPVVNALKRHAPDCRITWFLQPGPASLVRGHPAVDEIIEVEPGRLGWGSTRWVRELRDRSFDCVIDLQVAFKAGLLTAMLRAPLKLGFDRARARDLNWLFTDAKIPPHAPQHVGEQYFEFLSYLGVDPEPVEWRLGPWENERDWQRDFFAAFDRPVAAINIAASRAEKNWVPERWAALVDVLWADYGIAPVLVGGASAGERAIEEAIMSTARHRPGSALGSGLRRLVAILDGSALVVALDSAPLHIAVALNRPVIALMGNADPRRTGPFRRFHDLIVDAYHDPGQAGPVSARRLRGRMARIAVGNVLEKVSVWDREYRQRR